MEGILKSLSRLAVEDCWKEVLCLPKVEVTVAVMTIIESYCDVKRSGSKIQQKPQHLQCMWHLMGKQENH